MICKGGCQDRLRESLAWFLPLAVSPTKKSSFTWRLTIPCVHFRNTPNGDSLYSLQSSLYVTPTLCRGIRQKGIPTEPRLPHLSHVGERETTSGLCGSRSIAPNRQLQSDHYQWYPRSFSLFPHSTCTLSVIRNKSALKGAPPFSRKSDHHSNTWCFTFALLCGVVLIVQTRCKPVKEVCLSAKPLTVPFGLLPYWYGIYKSKTGNSR